MKVTANMSMSLDGFVNHPTDGVTTLFAWYSRGSVVTATANDEKWQLKTDAGERQVRHRRHHLRPPLVRRG